MYVVVTSECDAECLIRWGYYFATALERELTVLYARCGPVGQDVCDTVWDADLPKDMFDDTLTTIISTMRDLSQEHRQDPDAKLHIPGMSLRSLCDPDWDHAVLAEQNRTHPNYVLVAKLAPSGKSSQTATLARRIYDRATCTTILIRTRASRPEFPLHILVPTSGNPDTIDALKIGKRMAQCYGGEVTALYVSPEAGEMGGELGQHILGKVLQKAGLESGEGMVSRVEPDDDVSRGIRNVASEGFGLLLAGGPHVGAIRRMLFSTVPDRLFNSREGFTVAVVRSARPMLFRLRETGERWLDLSVPQLKREDRLDLMEALQRNSRWNFDFMALSTSIAALGLVQDSTAVVIGAMLVAPLMTPLLGAGLALVQGNRPLILSCSRSIL